MKLKRLLPIILVAALLVAILHFFGSARVAPLYTIRTNIVLPANLRDSWEMLTDFAEYPNWNPYLTRVEGRFSVGENMSFTLVDENFSDPLHLRATLGEVSPNKRFFWTGRVGIQGLFDTKHVFELVALDEERSEFYHYEEFRGLIPAILPDREKRSANTRAAFERMNRALRQRLMDIGG